MSSRGISRLHYGIGFLPNRSKVALYRASGGKVQPITYFNDAVEAQEFMMFIDRLVSYGKNDPRDSEWHGWSEVD